MVLGINDIIEHVSSEKENNDQDDDLSSLSNNIEDEETLVIIINDDAVEDIIMCNGIESMIKISILPIQKIN